MLMTKSSLFFALQLLFSTTLLVSSKMIELCELSREWGDKSYENKENCHMTNLDLEANFFTMGGFSSGGY